ncbi:J domain-containing protein [Legionella quateirensis]|uniref:Molecular chaperone DnaJ n=1 Tax=Legionella quateirensis TaxID=45072 RepID=A0A378KVU1_9GAMM|nr:J domain-containing protein [Legionella quateirensis]KTD46267.1 molecular chaperone DnaJ [Legionella quateirensis]STY18964.1 molecular chaperone DnaJ [Legionella quateirensis]
MATVYEVLGLEPTADFKKLKKAYRNKALENHPDRGGKEQVFKDLQNAWSLIDEEAKALSYYNKFTAKAVKPDWSESYAESISAPTASSYSGPFPSYSSSSYSEGEATSFPKNPTASKSPLSTTAFVPKSGGFMGFFTSPNVGDFVYRSINTTPLIGSRDSSDRALGFKIGSLFNDLDPTCTAHELLTAFKQLLTIMIEHADLRDSTDNKKYFLMNQLAELVGKKVTLESYHVVLADYARTYVSVEPVALLMEPQFEPCSSVPLLD